MQENNPLETFNPDDEIKIDFSKNKYGIKEEGELTDSDIDDPKYVPTSFSNNEINPKITQSPIPNLENINNVNIQNENYPNLNFHENKTIKSSFDDPKVQMKISELMEVIKKLESENLMLKNTLDKFNEDLQVKNKIICEFQNLIKMSKDKFNKYEETNNLLKKENENLRKEMYKFENEMKEVKFKSKTQENNLKNAEMLQEQFNYIQNNLIEKEKEITQKYKERETLMKNNLNDEIGLLNKKIDELKNENEKLKFELSNQKIFIENLKNNIDDRDFENESEIKKIEKENQKYKDSLNLYEKKI